jgi:hypothetical protein
MAEPLPRQSKQLAGHQAAHQEKPLASSVD